MSSYHGSLGRPTKATIQNLMLKGRNSHSSIKCPQCCRVFDRLKALRTHIKTHTGEKPYQCDYPGCKAKFVQSGQLRNHVYIHTLEKPFCCPEEGCTVRYTHANRLCTQHKSSKLIRDGKETIRSDKENLTKDQQEWLERYKELKINKIEAERMKNYERGERSASKDDKEVENDDQDSMSANSTCYKLKRKTDNKQPGSEDYKQVENNLPQNNSMNRGRKRKYNSISYDQESMSANSTCYQFESKTDNKKPGFEDYKQVENNLPQNNSAARNRDTSNTNLPLSYLNDPDYDNLDLNTAEPAELVAAYALVELPSGQDKAISSSECNKLNSDGNVSQTTVNSKKIEFTYDPSYLKDTCKVILNTCPGLKPDDAHAVCFLVENMLKHDKVRFNDIVMQLNNLKKY